MIEEHSFAQYIRTLGKGKRGQRSLTQEEAYTATKLILKNEVEDIQLGAFLMLMRVKEETPEEIAGFVQAVKEKIIVPDKMPEITIDWSSYAGKRRQLPWFVLSALLLSQNGLSVFMHGLSRDDERVYAQTALEAIGINICDSLSEVPEQINKTRFAYLDIKHISPLLNRMIELRQLLGLRSPGHTISRCLNPLSAKLLMQGIFHPGYAEIHQKAALLLDQPLAAVFKGEGGEIERDPDKYAIVQGVADNDLYSEEWAPVFNKPTRHLKEESLDLEMFKDVWSGKTLHEYGEAAVISTTAIVIKSLGLAETQQAAFEKATQWWINRMGLQAA
ncbi:MAG: glycosyl transferase family protein [Gammaproteobacteria bacterium]